MGSEALWVPLAVSALSAGVGYANNKAASDRQTNATVQGLQDQEKLRQQGNAEASALTKQIATDSPDKIAAKATGDYVKQLRTASANAKGSKSSALAPVVGGSSRYGSSVADAGAASDTYGRDYAGQMGQLDAAVRERQNEGLAQQTLGTNLNRLGAQSQTQGFVDSLRAAAAGTPNPYAALGSQLLGSFAGGLSKNMKPKVTPTSTTVAPNIWAGADYNPNLAPTV